MLSYLKLIKINNLLLIAIAQIAVKYGLLDPFDVPITLNGFGIFLLITATLCIAAAGNIIIEIYQNTSESEDVFIYNISEKSANRLFIILNVIGVLIGFYISNIIGKPAFASLFIIVSGVFYVYATYLKEVTVIKNITIGVLAMLTLLSIGIFDLLPAITEKNRESQTVFFSIIWDYALFGFFLIIIRELIKDCINMDEDHKIGTQTIPILLGKERTIKLIAIVSLIPIAGVIYYIYTYLFSNTNAVLAILFSIVAPLLIITIKAFGAENNKQLKSIKLLITLVLFLASLTMLFYQFLLLP